MAPTVSLCMIARNESEALPRCLEAARPWVDEIVVVDTGSSDNTADIARRHGARVVNWPWRDDFAAARNESLRHASGDWILVLDADEILTQGSGEALRRACLAGGEIVGFLVKILCPRDGDGGLVRLNWFPRLFRNLPGVRFDGVIHEQVIESLATRGAIERSAIEVLHTGYTLTAEEMAAKSQRNLRLLRRQLDREPSYAPGWFQLAETYVLMGKLDEAIEAYRRCLVLLRSSRLTLPAGVIAVALQNMGAALLARGNDAEGVDSLEAALAVDPGLVPAHVHLGTHALRRQRAADAANHFAQALAFIDQRGDEAEYETSPWLVHFLHGCAQARQEKLPEAIASFEAAVRINPRHAESLWLLALTAGNAGDWRRCLAALDRLALVGRDDFALHAQRATALGMLGRHAEAFESAERALAFEPGSAPVLALAAESLARTDRPAEAAACYERLAEASPDSPMPLLALAQCREAVGDREAMMRSYERAVSLAPDSPAVLFALGSACLRMDALEAAEECLTAAVERDGSRADYRLNHALCLIKRGETARAQEALEGIVARWPQLQQARELSALIARLPGAGPVGGRR